MRHALLVMLGACGGAPAKPTPPPPTCVAVADHTHSLIEPKDDHARKIRDVFAQRCERDVWSAEVRTCIASTTSLDSPKQCKSKLTPPQRDALDRDLAEADRVARAKRLPPSCEEYKQVIEKFMTCDKLPQQSRDALKAAFEAMEEGWANLADMPDDARAAMADSCAKGADAIKEAAAATCGW